MKKDYTIGCGCVKKVENQHNNIEMKVKNEKEKN